MNTYKKHSAHQNTSKSIAKKGLLVDFKEEKNSNSKARGFVVYPQRKVAKKSPMKLASGGVMITRINKTPMKSATTKSLEGKVKIAEKIADEMIKIACQYAEKWGTTSSVGFVTMYDAKNGYIILDKKKLSNFFKTQRENLLKCVANGGCATTGVLKGKSFNLNKGNIDITIRKIFIDYITRLGIAVATKEKKSVLKDVFWNLTQSSFDDITSEEDGGVSSQIAGVARFSYTNLRSDYKKTINGWKKMFKELDKAARLAELESEESLKYVDDKEENADDAVSVSASKYMPPETEMKNEIEDNAIKKAKLYYKSKGYTVTSVEKENCGWDLTVVSRDGKELHIEVKGTSRNEFHFFLSKNEYNQMKIDSNWRLFVVKNVLEDPDPDFVVKRPENVEKLFDLIPFCFEGTWKDE